MAEYELINPSDPYTFLAEDFETAALVVFVLSTAFGAQPKDGGEEVPLFVFGGASEWYKENFGRTPDEGIKAKRNALADGLLSMMYGHFEDRKRYNAALDAITDPEKREKFMAEWQDGHSSLNDIGTVAHKIGNALKSQEQSAGKEK